MTVSQQISPSALRAYKLSKYANGQPGKLLLEAKRAKRLTSQFMSRRGAKEAAARMKALKETASTTKKVADSVKNIQDLFLKKIPGTGDTDKATKASGLLGLLAAIGITGLLLLQEFISDRTFDNLTSLGLEMSKNLSLLTTVNSKVKSLNEKVDKFNTRISKELDTNAKDYARLNKSVEKTGQEVVTAKKQANDALYETRQGRAIVEKKINDNLYEIRGIRKQFESQISQLKSNFDKYISNLNTGFQSKIEATVNNLQRSLELANQEIRKTNTEVSLQQKTIDAASRITKALPASLNTAFKTVQDTTKKVLESNIIPIQQSAKRWGVTITPATVTPATVTVSESGGVTVTPSTGGVAQVTYADFSSTDIAREINAESKKQDGQISALASGLNTVANGVVGAQNTANLALQEARNKGVSFAPDITTLKGDVNQLKTDLGKIDTKLREQEKMNSAALPKLDEIINRLPFIPALTAAAIRPDIPTIPQIENAAATGTCRTTQSGGCMRRALDDSVANINQNTNNRVNALDIANAGMNGALLMGQQTILNRLGDQLPGGIGGKLTRFTQWLQLDRALNILTFAATVQNHLMLSNDIGQTLLGAFTNVLTLIGLEDDSNQPLDIGNIINSTIENLVKGIVGAENYTVISEAWSKANRIYQATNNVLNSFLNLSQTFLQASELIAANTGKIGNALRKGGVILESAYGWMNPQPKFNRVTGFLEKFQNGASTIQMVTQAPLDIVNATTELTTASTDFVKAIKEDNKPENKATPTPEPDELKAKEQAGKADSQPVNFDFSDLFDGED